MEKKGIKRQNSLRTIFGYSNSALTLIELIIVVTIVALLSVLSVTIIKNQISKGYDARRKADIKKIQIAAEEYEKDNDCYPTTIVCNDTNQGITPYLKVVPCDPRTELSYAYEPENLRCPSWYRIYAKLENERDVNFLSNIGPGFVYNYYASSPNAPKPARSSQGGATATTRGGYWGCKNGVCTQLSGRNECSPNFTTSTCGTGCTPIVECL